MKPSFTVYSDFNCPFCYGLNERLIPYKNDYEIQWKGVQHAHHLPIPMAEASPDLSLELKNEVAMMAKIAPELSIRLPVGKPNTPPAILAVAALMVESQERATALKDRLYRDFWTNGIDISDEAHLRKAAKEAGLSDEFRFESQRETAKRWHIEWFQNGLGSVPALIRSDGRILMGLASETELRNFIVVTT